MPLASGTRLAVYEIQAPLPPSTIHKLTHYRTLLFGAHRKFTGL